MLKMSSEGSSKATFSLQVVGSGDASLKIIGVQWIASHGEVLRFAASYTSNHRIQQFDVRCLV